MDRNQQNRRKKSGAASHAAKHSRSGKTMRTHRQTSPNRGLGTRVGIEKRPVEPVHPATSGKQRAQRPAAQTSRNSSSRPQQPVGSSPRQPSQRQQQEQPRRQQEPTRRTRYHRNQPPTGQVTSASRNPQNAAYRPGAPRHQRRVTQVEKMRIRRRRKIIGILCMLGVLAVGVFLSINLLFKVTDFRIENMDRTTPANTGIYTEEQILQLLDVQVGDNLFGFSTRKKSEELKEQLPYLDDVQVNVQMPGTVVIKVQPATERFAVETSSGWLILSDGLKVLRSDSAQPEGLIQLDARLNPNQPTTPGSYLVLMDSDTLVATGETAESAGEEDDATDSRAETVLNQLMEKLDEYGMLDGVTLLSLRDLEEISFLYQGRVSVVLGTANNLDYKMQFASKIVLDADGKGLTSTDRGTLNVSHQRSDGSIMGYFTPAQASPESAAPATDTDSTGDAQATTNASPAATPESANSAASGDNE